jgi:hypothetical protein
MTMVPPPCQIYKKQWPKSAYAAHILKNVHDCGDISNISLNKQVRKGPSMKTYEGFYIQLYVCNNELVAEQYLGECNPLFQLLNNLQLLHSHVTWKLWKQYVLPVSLSLSTCSNTPCSNNRYVLCCHGNSRSVLSGYHKSLHIVYIVLYRVTEWHNVNRVILKTFQYVWNCCTQSWWLQMMIFRFLRLYPYSKSNSCILNNCIQKLYLYCWILRVIIICDIPEDEPVIGSKHVG